MQLFFWVLDGVVGGWLTSKIMSSEGRDLVMDIVMGISGGAAGGFIVAAMHPSVQGKMIFTNLAAVVGAVVLSFLTRIIGGRREYGSTN
jgi:uncharacterized membrane protein YeaQ/YmgE (transglycosylase-associated protein family)